MRLTWRLLADLPPDALDASDDTGLAVVLADVDRLAVINHAVGVAAADEFIDALDRRMREWAATDALAVHLEGGKYAVVTRAVSRRAFADRLDGLRLLLCAPVRTRAGTLTRSISIGVATSFGPEVSINDLVLRADAALAAAKRAGGGQLRMWDEASGAYDAGMGHLELELQEALRTGEGLLLHYQPEIDLRTGEMLAVEALARWQHPRLGLLAADTFIGVAEASGVIDAIGEWALREAIAQRGRWAAAVPDTMFAVRVNVPPSHLVDRSLPQLVSGLLATHGVRGEQVGIEVTERDRSLEPRRVIAVLTELKRLGLDVALDDFGVAYSSPARIGRFPFDALKIDRQFVHGLAENELGRFVVEAVVRLTELLGSVAVAEGVQDESDARELVRLRCYRAQGHWLMPPVGAADLDELVHRGHLDLPPLPGE